MKPLTEWAEWQALKSHQKDIAGCEMSSWFKEDPMRAKRFSLQAGDFLLDYSKNRITEKTISLLLDLAKAANLSQKIDDLFIGKSLNSTENRPALHTALRNRSKQAIYVNQNDIMPEVRSVLQKMQDFVEKIHQQTWLGATGKPIKHIVNVGIGGSHLGPLLTTSALSQNAITDLQFHFVSNIDGTHLNHVLQKIDPETTLFIISSKSFTTLETMTHAKTIRAWLEKKLNQTNLSNHFIAVTSAIEKANAFGISADAIFPLWEWVGGRFSVWSAIGLPLALMIGMPGFYEFLDGAYEMDQHFRHTDLRSNMPVILAMLGLWYINFFQTQSYAIIPYSDQLDFLRLYLQQLDMESNGKSTTHTGTTTQYHTAPIIWGEQGCNGQHAFYQLLHQGPYFIPVDFILVAEHPHPLEGHQDILIASALSQAKALMQGKPSTHLHKAFQGNRPSNILFMPKLTSRNLGALLALYEHKTFVQGVIWDINSFDQWGVELGKELLPQILLDFQTDNANPEHDPSTMHLIQHYKKMRNSSCEKL